MSKGQPLKSQGFISLDCLCTLLYLSVSGVLLQRPIVDALYHWQKAKNTFKLLENGLFVQSCLTRQLKNAQVNSIQLGSPFHPMQSGYCAFLATTLIKNQPVTFGYRWRLGNLEYQTHVTRLDSPYWQSLLDANWFQVEAFQILPLEEPMKAVKITFVVCAKHKPYPIRANFCWIVPFGRLMDKSV